MSKSNLRKITVDSKCNSDSRRPSVFERLGTKPVSTTSNQSSAASSASAPASDYCRNWALNGNCSYGKTCKYASTHTLISPSKRVKKDSSNASNLPSKEDPLKRITSKIVKKTSHSPDLNIEEWNQTDLEYEDEKVLERRLQLLQRELEIQMKKDKEVHGKELKTKLKKKVMSSSSSSRSSSTSSSSTSSSSDDSSSSSTSDSHKKVKKVKSKQRHHSASSEYEDDKDRKRKLKLKRVTASKTEKLPVKKKRKVESPTKKDVAVKPVKKAVPVVKKHTSVPKAKSPAPVVSSSKVKDQNRSESPKGRVRHCETSDRHSRKGRESEDSSKDLPKSKPIEKSKEIDKVKSRLHEEKSKLEDKSRIRVKEKEIRSRTPPLDRLKHPPPLKELPAKPRRSRTPEKPRSKRDTPPPRQDKIVSKRELEKKERDVKFDKIKEKEESRKGEIKSRSSSSQDDNQRKNLSRDIEDRNRQRSRERRDIREERHPRVKSDQREKEREDLERSRERQRERDREREKNPKFRDREMVASTSTSMSSLDKSSRYVREKERLKDGKEDKSIRDRRSEREREVRGSEKVSERDRSCQRYDSKYDRLEKPVERDRLERYPRERSLDRGEKSVPTSSRDHLVYDRGSRHRRVNTSHTSVERKELPSKIERLPERRESPRRSLEIERSFDRSYTRVSSDHWDQEDYHHDEERRKPIEPRRFSSPFNDRRSERTSSRYSVSGERSYDEHHPIYPEKLRPVRDEGSNDRVYPEWEEREWRPRNVWERESLPRSEAHEEEWTNQRYDSPITDWKVNDSRKWENPQLHLRGFRNERHKEELGIPDVHKRRPPEIRPFNTPEIRDEANLVPKPNVLHGNMKEEPINKKLMELAEGRLRRSREKSIDVQKKVVIKEKPPEVVKEKEVEKKVVLDDSSQHESDLSDISDDPDDILNMDDVEAKQDKETKPVVEEQQPEQTSEEAPPPVQEKLKEEPETVDEENIETMDFEEISDGELEEDIKTSGKGLGDALGVDWESLVVSSQPRRPISHPDSAQSRWQCKAIFQRIGISVKYAGDEFVDKITKKYAKDDDKFLLDDVAMIHTALFREKIAGDSANLIDDHLYKVHSELNGYYDSSEDDPDVLKPVTELFEEAKMFLQQSSITV